MLMQVCMYQRACRRRSAAGCSPESGRCLLRSLVPVQPETVEALENGGGEGVVLWGPSVTVGVTEDRQEGMIAQCLFDAMP